MKKLPKIPRFPRHNRDYQRPEGEDLFTRASSKNQASQPGRPREADEFGWSDRPQGNRRRRPHSPAGWDPDRDIKPAPKPRIATGDPEVHAPAGKHRGRGTAKTSHRGRHRAPEDSYTGRHQQPHEGQHRKR